MVEYTLREAIKALEKFECFMTRLNMLPKEFQTLFEKENYAYFNSFCEILHKQDDYENIVPQSLINYYDESQIDDKNYRLIFMDMLQKALSDIQREEDRRYKAWKLKVLKEEQKLEKLMETGVDKLKSWKGKRKK